MSQEKPHDDDDIVPVETLAGVEVEPEIEEVQPEPEGLRRCRRFVNVTPNVRVGRRAKLFAYGYADLADLLALSEPAIRQAVRRGSFKPGDLRSVFEFLLTRLANPRVREKLLGKIPEIKKDDEP